MVPENVTLAPRTSEPPAEGAAKSADRLVAVAAARAWPMSWPTPKNTALPSIAGAAQEGQLLTVGSGTWSGTPASRYIYVWERCSAAGRCKKSAAPAKPTIGCWQLTSARRCAPP